MTMPTTTSANQAVPANNDMERTSPTLLVPSLIIGVGGTGISILREMKRVFRPQWRDEYSEKFQLLEDKIEIEAAESQSQRLARGEGMGVAARQAVSRYPRFGTTPGEALHNYQATFSNRQPWADTLIDPGTQHSNIDQRASGWLQGIYQRVTDRFEYVTRTAALKRLSRQAANNNLTVFIVASLTGGTGAGLFLGLASIIHNTIRRHATNACAGARRAIDLSPWMFYEEARRIVISTTALGVAGAHRLLRIMEPKVQPETCLRWQATYNIVPEELARLNHNANPWWQHAELSTHHQGAIQHNVQPFQQTFSAHIPQRHSPGLAGALEQGEGMWETFHNHGSFNLLPAHTLEQLLQRSAKEWLVAIAKHYLWMCKSISTCNRDSLTPDVYEQPSGITKTNVLKANSRRVHTPTKDENMSHSVKQRNSCEGNVYAAGTENHRIQTFHNSGQWLISRDLADSLQGHFAELDGIAVDNAGNVDVVDTGNHRVQKFPCEVGNHVYSSILGIQQRLKKHVKDNLCILQRPHSNCSAEIQPIPLISSQVLPSLTNTWSSPASGSVYGGFYPSAYGGTYAAS